MPDEDATADPADGGPVPAGLLAVDLGLRTGFASFAPDGAVRRVGSSNLGSRDRLRRAIPGVVTQYGPVSVLVVEGDRTLAAPWIAQAERRGAAGIEVAPETWRALLLHPRERRDGRRAKAAADPLARTTLEVLGGVRPTSLRHDAAEAVLIGLWALVHLGWLPQLPAALDPRRR
ncbi:MAG: hypothetical protein JJT89_09380 [Nitriliruptoraceae bacterium]|nr:hypothetical protein [Nitriliruptoraceae bacterium]